MLFAYFDESGDGNLPSAGSPTTHLVLSCILVPDRCWLEYLDQLVLLRRWLRDVYGIPTRRELKARFFKNGKGAFRGLGTSRPQRMRIYGEILERLATTLPEVRIFAVAVDKEPAFFSGWDARTAVWTFALQRVDRECEARDGHAVLFPDEGHGYFIRKKVRAMRRFHQIPGRFGGTRRIDVRRVLEDPNDRSSHNSFFTQMADLAAYAALRHQDVDPAGDVPSRLWEALQSILHLPVNRLTGGPPGIVLYRG